MEYRKKKQKSTLNEQKIIGEQLKPIGPTTLGMVGRVSIVRGKAISSFGGVVINWDQGNFFQKADFDLPPIQLGRGEYVHA